MVSACAPAAEDGDRLARAGLIDRTAPIVADQSIEIAAPDTIVWDVVSRIDRWPRWHPTVSAATMRGATAPGTTFEWINGGTTIASTIALVRPRRVIAWTGHAFGLNAVHVWTIGPRSGGRTVVRTTESMRGWPASLVLSSADLRTANAAWLRALKTEAEARTRAMGSYPHTRP